MLEVAAAPKSATIRKAVARTTIPRAMYAYSGSVARPKAGTEQMRAFNDAAGKDAEEVLLDDVGLVIFDAFEPVRDMEPVADFLRP